MKRILIVGVVLVAGCSEPAAVDMPLVRTGSGLEYAVFIEGEGEPAAWGDRVTIHESTTKEDGTLIFSTWKTGQPLSFTLGADQVVDGMEELVVGMRVGERRHAVMPPAITKRERYPDSFGPEDTLLFEVVLVGIERGGARIDD